VALRVAADATAVWAKAAQVIALAELTVADLDAQSNLRMAGDKINPQGVYFADSG